MALIAVSSLMRTIEVELLQPNPRFVLQNRDLIISIHQKLGHLLALLDESEKKADNYEEIARIREVMFKAEDDIEAALLEALHQPETAPPWSLFPLANLLQWVKDNLQIRSKSNTAPKKLDETLRSLLQCIQELMDMLQIPDEDDDGPSSGDSSLLHVNISNPDSSLHSSKLDEEAMVGHSTQFREVMAQIFRSSLEQLLIMAMIGMGGIGKTTFARKIYNDPRVASHFNLRGWTTVSQERSVAQVLLELCRSIRSMPDGDTNTAKADEVAAHLRKSLLGRRYLIIVDDIWTEKAWDEIQTCFPDENNGSRILLTTRQKEVADYADAGEYSFNMRFLDPDEGWELFYQKLHVKEPLNNEFEIVGRNIVQKCHGLPLAIVLLAGLLSVGNKSLDEWKNLETTINSLVALDLGEQFYSRIFTLSYNNLPKYLKGCFLYLGLFPEDREIPLKKIIRLWVAEGLVTTVREKRIEEVAQTYLHDLINRSLVMISGQSFDGKIKTCKIHDLLHDLCVDKIKKEKLVYVHQEKDYNNWIYDPDNRWVSFRGTYSTFNSFHPSLMRVRSIFYLNTYGLVLSDFYSHTNTFKRLRVLDLSEMPLLVHNVRDDIVDLVFLRYLALPSFKLLCCITLWRNWNLQTLIITDFYHVNRPSRWIWDLPQLRHLRCHYEIPMNPPETSVQENLQTFFWLHVSQCTEQVLLSIPNVKELGIYAQGEQSHPIDNLYLLNHLEKLTIRGIYLPLKLPPHADAFPLNLKKLTIRLTTLKWEDMTVVSMLPNLEVLKLKENVYKGQEWELTKEKGFPRLKVLLISSSNLRDWKADDIDDPFPVLEHLLLRNCDELKELPSWIEGIHTLQLMQFDKCRRSLVNSARQIQEERQGYGDDELAIKELDTQPEDNFESENQEWIEDDRFDSDDANLLIEFINNSLVS